MADEDARDARRVAPGAAGGSAGARAHARVTLRRARGMRAACPRSPAGAGYTARSGPAKPRPR